MQTCHVNMVYTDHGFIVQQTLPSRIHRLGRVCLRHLGEMPNRAERHFLPSPKGTWRARLPSICRPSYRQHMLETTTSPQLAERAIIRIIIVTSKDSSMLFSGWMPRRARANRVFPLPGLPAIIMLWTKDRTLFSRNFA
jgi:hypothetical protein